MTQTPPQASPDPTSNPSWSSDRPPAATPTPPPAPPAPPTSVGPPARRLTRSRNDRMIAGVCGGVASYLGVDPVLVRLAAVALTVFGGSGIVLYLAGWILIPEE